MFEKNISNLESKDYNFNILSDDVQNQNKYEFSFENYLIIFEIQDNKLNIEIRNNLNSDKYQRQYSLEELIEINRVFSMFDKIEDCINSIEINANNMLITTEDKICVLTIKLDTKELPKNKISDLIIFKIPFIRNKFIKR
jgi:hypothetical protein